MLKTSCPKREMENMRGGKGLLHATDLTTVEECYGMCGCSATWCWTPVPPSAITPMKGRRSSSTSSPANLLPTTTALWWRWPRARCLPPGHGEGHAMENPTAEPVEFIAMIVVE